jgi:hypothetical protein
MTTRLLVPLLAVSLAAAPALARGSDDASSAKEHYKRGLTLYELGKYDDAVTEFEQAYEIKDDPILLYNIAQALRLNKKYSEAVRFYRTYLKRKPGAANRADVEQKVASLEELVEAEKKMATAPPPDAIPPTREGRTGRQPPGTTGSTGTTGTTSTRVATRESPPPSRTESAFGAPHQAEVPETHAETPPREGQNETPPARETRAEPKSDTGAKPGRIKLIAGIVVAAVGLAALAAGIGLGVTAASDSSAQEKSMVFNPSLQSEGQLFGTVGLVMDVIGGAALAAGVTVAVLGVLQKPETEKVTIAPSLGRNSAGASLLLRF